LVELGSGRYYEDIVSVGDGDFAFGLILAEKSDPAFVYDAVDGGLSGYALTAAIGTVFFVFP